jgi:hypothetical protein
MQPHLFLDAARDLARIGGPAQCRSAISRAYYAVYNVAEDFLRRMGFQRPKKDYHSTLHRRLMAGGDAAIVQLGNDLQDFHQERVDADYKMADKAAENPANAQAAIVKADQMIQTLTGCPIYGASWNAIRVAIARANITGTDDLVLGSGS